MVGTVTGNAALRVRVRVIGYLLVLAACVTSRSSRPFPGTLPPNTQLDMAGAFTFSPGGELRLALAEPCVIEVRSARAPCDRTRLDQIEVVAHAPWNQDVRGTWRDAGHIAFVVDWKAVAVDPLAGDALATVARPWTVSGTQWTPSSAEAGAILKAIGDATDTEIELSRGGPPPRLEVTTFAAEGEGLHAGQRGTLVVRIANRGAGTAYRVDATTRSSVEALHGLRFPFGSIAPGADKVRTRQVTVPASEAATDTMLVLELTEGNGVAPGSISRRIPIGPSTAAPVLGMQCTVGDRKARPDFDAGEAVTLRCSVDNSGDAEAARVELEVTVAGGAPVRSAPAAIAASGHRTFEVPAVVPRTLPIDAPVEIEITARDRGSSRTAHAMIVGVVRKPRLCVRGQLTRPQYQAKVKELRGALTSGNITQAEFDRYDAELVACLR